LRETEGNYHSPPIKLAQKTWAQSKTLEINKVRLKHPAGFQETIPSNASRWAGTLRKVADVYVYKRIPSDHVRLLLIKPGAYDDDIYTSLLVVPDHKLNDDNHQYCALSYHWGDGAFNNTIFIQEDAASRPLKTLKDVVDTNYKSKQPKKFMIKPNLHQALKHLRDQNDFVAIWIDALCINQFDEEEKNEQVNKMALIYRKAYNVNIWLGADSSDNLVSDMAMTFIAKVIDPDSHEVLLTDDVYIKSWASLFELLKWSWYDLPRHLGPSECFQQLISLFRFSRRWVIQELALSQNATVHCGKHVCFWSEFQTAIAIFCMHFNALKPKLKAYFENSQPRRWSWNDDSMLEIEQLGAKLLIDMTANLFRPKKNGTRESTKGLETLVCSLSAFDSSDPRDTINALRNISKELNRPDSEIAKSVPAPDYGKDLFEVYRDFVAWVVLTSRSLDIICRFWALKERKNAMPTTPRLVELPSWIQFVEDSAWGKGEDRFNGRQAGDSFVGLPDDHNYCASGQGHTYREPRDPFPNIHARSEHNNAGSKSPAQVIYDMSLLARGVTIGEVSYRTDPFPDSIITKDCLKKLGWSSDRDATEIAEVPDQLWQTLVADRGPQGSRTLPWYKVACQNALRYLSNNGHINIERILRRKDLGGQQSIVKAYLERVQAVTWNRSFIEGCSINSNDQVVGFAPPKTETGDVIVILHGCSVPVILRPTHMSSNDVQDYFFVGEAYIYGKMDGEAFDEDYQEQEFRLR
jgi:hypothetical protein